MCLWEVGEESTGQGEAVDNRGSDQSGGTTASGCLGPPEAGRRRTDPPLESAKDHDPGDTLGLDFWAPECGRRGSFCFRPSGCGHLLCQPQDTGGLWGQGGGVLSLDSPLHSVTPAA